MRDFIIETIKSLGADLVGIAGVQELKDGPSETLFPVMKDHSRDHFAEEITTGLAHGRVFWEEDARSAIVYAVAHPKEEPQLDWWCGETDPPGNRRLLEIAKQFRKIMSEKYPQVRVYPKRYHVERGGIYLKEAAVRAGLGCIGRNNLLVTPQFGPRVRLRALLISEELEPTGPLAFDPCALCDEPCRRGCPQKAFADVVYTYEETGLEYRPGRDGRYNRAGCAVQMKKNEDEAAVGLMPEISDQPDKIIKYCRNCELLCPVGK